MTDYTAIAERIGLKRWVHPVTGEIRYYLPDHLWKQVADLEATAVYMIGGQPVDEATYLAHRDMRLNKVWIDESGVHVKGLSPFLPWAQERVTAYLTDDTTPTTS